MTSPLPPKRRDTRTPWDLLRQDRTNLRQLNNGLMGGRAPMLRPLPGPLADGDDFDDDAGDDDQPAAWNIDTATATVAGQVSLVLTYEPIDGTLMVFWDGEYLHPSAYTLTGQTVTFTDRHIHVGDRLDAAYWYWPADVPGAPGPATVTARTPGTYAWGSSSSGGGAGLPIPLPAGSVVGDLIVVSAIAWPATITDPRLTAVGNGMWVGWATDLSPVAVSHGDAWYGVACETFETNASGWTAAQVAANGSIAIGGTIATPVVTGVAAAICGTTAFVAGFGNSVIGTPTGYTNVAATNSPLSAGINLWSAADIGDSPAGTISYSGGASGGLYATGIGLIGPEI